MHLNVELSDGKVSRPRIGLHYNEWDVHVHMYCWSGTALQRVGCKCSHVLMEWDCTTMSGMYMFKCVAEMGLHCNECDVHVHTSIAGVGLRFGECDVRSGLKSNDLYDLKITHTLISVRPVSE